MSKPTKKPTRRPPSQGQAPVRDSGLQRPHYAPLPGFLKALREAAGLTQRGLAAKMNRGQKWIWDCESGNRRVDVTEFMDWCEYCGRNPAEALRAYHTGVHQKGYSFGEDTLLLWREVAETIESM